MDPKSERLGSDVPPVNSEPSQVREGTSKNLNENVSCWSSAAAVGLSTWDRLAYGLQCRGRRAGAGWRSACRSDLLHVSHVESEPRVPSPALICF